MESKTMIKANELRIGNCVLDRGNKILTIDRFIGNKIECDIKGMPDKSENGIPIYYHPFTEEINYLNPIPLTEEWLEKFGIDFTSGEEWYYLTFTIKDLLFETSSSIKGFTYNLCCDNQINFQYVHQLQNLYFCLCGEELTIKEVNL